MEKKLFVFFSVMLSVFALSELSFAWMPCPFHLLMGKKGGAHKHAAATAAQSTTKEAVNVGNKICPVLGNKIEEVAKATYEYEGKSYNLCCAGCIDTFKKDPKKYVQKAETELRAGLK